MGINNKNPELTREAADSAIQNISKVKGLIEDYVDITYGDFKILSTKDGREINNLKTTNFQIENCERIKKSIVDNYIDLKTCYEHMGLLEESN